MTNKVNVNLNVPDELLAELSGLVDAANLNSKQKWVMVSAAILLLLETPKEYREQLLDLVVNAERKGFAPLIAEAKKIAEAKIDLDFAPSGAKLNPQSVAAVSPAAPARGKGKSREASRSR